MKFLKKYHKWLGVILSIFIILFSISGIVLNHRELFSGFDVSQSSMPEKYHYHNWDNASVRASVELSPDSILVYGDIGIWLTNKDFSEFTDFNNGLPYGADNHKTCKIIKTKNNQLFAATLFGLWKYNRLAKEWKNINLNLHKKHIVDVLEADNKIIALSRSHILTSSDGKTFKKIILPDPENYDNKIGLFKTLWVIHSGEIWGFPGVIIVDIIGLIFMFLSITGLIFFFNPTYVKLKLKLNKDITKTLRFKKWNLKWHNKIGWTTVIFLIITTSTGMFLRPPLLAFIFETKVGKIPFTELSDENAWFDKLKKITFDKNKQEYLIATTEGIYRADKDFSTKLELIYNQPPISVMGVNVFTQTNDSTILVGSFSGFYEWNIHSGLIQNYISKTIYDNTIEADIAGENLVSGYIPNYKGNEYYLDFDKGAVNINNKTPFIAMPNVLKEQRISLWRMALEVHTARIYGSIIGGFYILLIPLLGIFILFILISGFIIWWKKHK